LESKLTFTSVTPGILLTLFSMCVEQAEQLIPEISNFFVVIFFGPLEGNASG